MSPLLRHKSIFPKENDMTLGANSPQQVIPILTSKIIPTTLTITIHIIQQGTTITLVITTKIKTQMILITYRKLQWSSRPWMEPRSLSSDSACLTHAVLAHSSISMLSFTMSNWGRDQTNKSWPLKVPTFQMNILMRKKFPSKNFVRLDASPRFIYVHIPVPRHGIILSWGEMFNIRAL